MSERSIPFSGPMVKAILSGAKTQMRSIGKPVRGFEHHNICKPDMAADPWAVWWHGDVTDCVGVSQECPFGKPGDRLWVQETFMAESRETIHYRADGWGYSDCPNSGWKRSIYMPRWASRITLEITDVRIERLNDISEEDARAEGVSPCTVDPYQFDDEDQSYEAKLARALGPGEFTAKFEFRRLWDKINSKKHPWHSNPFVWVISFKKVPHASR